MGCGFFPLFFLVLLGAHLVEITRSQSKIHFSRTDLDNAAYSGFISSWEPEIIHLLTHLKTAFVSPPPHCIIYANSYLLITNIHCNTSFPICCPPVILDYSIIPTGKLLNDGNCDATHGEFLTLEKLLSTRTAITQYEHQELMPKSNCLLLVLGPLLVIIMCTYCILLNMLITYESHIMLSHYLFKHSSKVVFMVIWSLYNTKPTPLLPSIRYEPSPFSIGRDRFAILDHSMSIKARRMGSFWEWSVPPIYEVAARTRHPFPKQVLYLLNLFARGATIGILRSRVAELDCFTCLKQIMFEI